MIDDELEVITSGTTDDTREGGVYKLLPLEHRLSWLEVRLERCLKMLDLLLGNDEDMAAMYLTRLHTTGDTSTTEHLKVELILETYVRPATTARLLPASILHVGWFKPRVAGVDLRPCQGSKCSR